MASEADVAASPSIEATTWTVALVMMPFGPIDRPSLGLSRCLGEAGFATKVLYPALAFAARIGNERYDDIALLFSRGLVGNGSSRRRSTRSAITATS